jgi:lysyl-tRNA synthetase class 2
VEQNWRLAGKKEILTKRARIIQQVRAFFIDGDFLEIETPHRIPANAPELHIDAVASEDWFLQTSPELCMKRLLAAGYERLFQLCRCWRSGERGRRHLPEYSMLEWYRSQCDYRQLMSDCENLLTALCPARAIPWNGRTIDLTPPWPRLTVAEAFARFASLSLDQALASDRFDIVLSEEIEPRLPSNRPLFLYDYPVEQASLARQKATDDTVAERVELYIGGLEIANGFSELNDRAEQRRRFEAEERQRRAMGKKPYPVPTPFLDELDHLPPAAGIALGIDRLIMLLCHENAIENVVAFPPELL